MIRKSTILALLLLFAGLISAGVLGGQKAAAITLPAPTIIARQCNQSFFGLEPWYHFMPAELGVPQEGDVPADPCAVHCFNIFVQGQPNDCGQTASDIPGVILAVIDDLLRIAGLVAVAFILKGSFEFVGSRGNSERTAGAQSTVIAALTGLAIAVAAVALVSFLGGQLGS